MTAQTDRTKNHFSCLDIEFQCDSFEDKRHNRCLPYELIGNGRRDLERRKRADCKLQSQLFVFVPRSKPMPAC